MRVAICEDLSQDMTILARLLNQHAKEHQMDITIDLFENADQLLGSYQQGIYHILFLDVLMEGTSGMDAAQTIREIDNGVAIVFITISPDFAVDSYLIDAAFYIVKPVNKIDLDHALNRCRDIINQQEKVLMLAQGKKLIRIPAKDILYVETQRNDRLIHTFETVYRTRQPLSSLEQELGGLPFLRCHNSFLINFDHVVNLDRKDFILETGTKVPVSKAYYTSVQKQYYRYIFDEARGPSLIY